MKDPCAPLFRIGFLLLLAFPAVAGAQTEGAVPYGFGVSAGLGLGGAPLGQIAERNGMLAIPGKEYELRALLKTPARAEWSLGFIADGYSLDQRAQLNSQSVFDYHSAGLVAGYGRTEIHGSVPIQSRIEVGWRRFQASSSGRNFYTGDAEASHITGHAAVVGVSLGVEIPLESMSLVPRVRVETSYPDIGGGDGYSRLHRAHDLGFRISFAVGLQRMFGSEH